MKIIKCNILTVTTVTYILSLLLFEHVDIAVTQNPDPLFELPVQLVGFPVIVLSVRLSQFAKKLAYSLNPNTYRARTKRELDFAAHAGLVEKEILQEFGPKACIMDSACSEYAAYKNPQNPHKLPLISYRNNMAITKMKQWHMLSMFIGDALKDVNLCHYLAQRLPCQPQKTILSAQPRLLKTQ